MFLVLGLNILSLLVGFELDLSAISPPTLFISALWLKFFFKAPD
jgi:hypothetical protein